MQVVSLTEARNNLKSVFDTVYKDNDEYNAMKETQYLLSSHANRERLLSSLKELREEGVLKMKDCYDNSN